ncbi:retrovirus-related pol polyprotein from transposon TNT 1-94 [Tanacetum coccineum]
MITQPTVVPSENNTEIPGTIIEPLVPDVTQSHIINQASTSSHHVSQDRWSRDQHIELVNIIGDPNEGMLTRSMVSKLTAASASECLFVDFLSKIEPKKLSEALKHPGWINAMKEELNQFYRNKIWTLVLLPYGKIAIGSKWVFMNKKDEDVARMEAIRIFLAFATYMNFKVYQMDVKSTFLNGKLKEEVYVKQPPSFESSEFPDYVCKLDKALYGLKQAPRAYFSMKTPMVPPNNLGPNLAGKSVNETSYRGMSGSLMYLKGTPTLGLYYPKCLGFDLEEYSDSDYVGCNMDRKSTSAEAEYVAAAGCCASILWMKSQLNDYDIHYKMVPIFCDNTSAIAISNNLVLHSRTKHIDIRYHFIRDHILKGDIELHFIPTEYQLADIFTKPLNEPTFTRLKAELGMDFWSTVVPFDPFSSTDDPEKRPLKEFLIKFFVLNGKRPLTLNFDTFCSSTGLNYNNGKYVDHPTPKVFGGNYSSNEQVNSIQQLLAYSLITGTKDPSKVTNIKLTAHMIAVNNRMDSVSPLPLVAKPKKGKSQTVASTLPKS